jgi:hypothetical protein
VQRERLYRSFVGGQESTDGGRLADCLVIVWWCWKDSSQYAGVFIGCKKAGGESASMTELQPGSTLILHKFALGFVQTTTPTPRSELGFRFWLWTVPLRSS